MKVEIITPQSVMFQGEADHLVAPGAKGRFGVLKNHAPMISLLEAGQLRIDGSDGSRQIFAIDGGMLEVDEAGVVVLTDSAEPS